MTVLITDAGFTMEQDSWRFVPLEERAANDCAGQALDVPSDADLAGLEGSLKGVNIIRVDFPSFSDGRGFTIAARLRRMGFSGRLRARGHVLADQYAMARRSGFDEVEISDDLAARQPEDQWLARANWQDHNHQARLRGTPA